MWFYVYILQSKKDNKLYTGCTKNLKSRLEMHNHGLVVSTKYRRPLALIYFEGYRVKEDAYKREKYLKSIFGKMYLKRRLKNTLLLKSI